MLFLRAEMPAVAHCGVAERSKSMPRAAGIPYRPWLILGLTLALVTALGVAGWGALPSGRAEAPLVVPGSPLLVDVDPADPSPLAPAVDAPMLLALEEAIRVPGSDAVACVPSETLISGRSLDPAREAIDEWLTSVSGLQEGCFPVLSSAPFGLTERGGRLLHIATVPGHRTEPAWFADLGSRPDFRPTQPIAVAGRAPGGLSQLGGALDGIHGSGSSPLPGLRITPLPAAGWLMLGGMGWIAAIYRHRRRIHERPAEPGGCRG
jgi:hypothetical protein